MRTLLYQNYEQLFGIQNLAVTSNQQGDLIPPKISLTRPLDNLKQNQSISYNVQQSDSQQSSDEDGGLLDDILAGGGEEQDKSTAKQQQSQQLSAQYYQEQQRIKEQQNQHNAKLLALASQRANSLCITLADEQAEKQKFLQNCENLQSLLSKCKQPLLLKSNVDLIIKHVIFMRDLDSYPQTKDLFSDILLKMHWLAKLQDSLLKENRTKRLITGQPWNTYQITLALHSKDQDALLRQLVPQEDQLTWQVFKHYSIPLWYKDPTRLATLTNTIATNQFNHSQQEEDIAADKANHVAIWLVAIKKISKLVKFYELENNQKVAKYLKSDFSKPKILKQAEKNAYLLKSQKKYTLCAAFFLLANKPTQAIHILLRDEKDLNLAVLATRLHEGENSPQLLSMYKSQFVNKAECVKDIWLASIGNWLMKQYVQAVNSIASGKWFKKQLNQQEEQDELFQLQKQLKLTEQELQDIQNQDQYNLTTQTKNKTTQAWAYTQPVLSLPNKMISIIVQKVRGHYLVINQIQSFKSKITSGPSIFDSHLDKIEEEKKAKMQGEQKFKRIVFRPQDFQQINAINYQNSGLPYFSLNGQSTRIQSSMKLVQMFVRDILQKVGAQTSKNKIQEIVQYLNSHYSVKKSLLYNLAVDEFMNKGDVLSSYLVRSLYQGRSTILSSLLVDILRLTQHALASYPFSANTNLFQQSSSSQQDGIKYFPQLSPATKKQYNNILYEIQNLLNILILMSTRNNSILSTGHSPPKQRKSQDLSFDASPAHRIPSQYPDQHGSFDSSFNQQQDQNDEYLNSITILLQHLYFNLHYVLYQLSIFTHCFGSSVAILINMQQIFTASNFDISHIEKLHIILKQMQATLALRDAQSLQSQDISMIRGQSAKNTSTNNDDKSLNIRPYKCLDFVKIFLQDVCARQLVKLMNSSFFLGSRNQSRTINLNQASQVHGMQYLQGQILINQLKEQNLYKIVTYSDLFITRAFVEKNIENMQRKYAFNKSMFNSKELNFRERSEIAKSMYSFFIKEKWRKASKVLDISYYFKDKLQAKKFSDIFNIKSQMKRLSRSYQKQIHHDQEDQLCKNSQIYTQNLYSNGIQIFHLKGEQIAGFTINSCHQRNMAIALPHKGSRQINIQHTLLFRNRKPEEMGLKIMDDQLKTWEQCLHRYDNLVESHRRDDFNLPFQALQAANDKLFPHNFNIKHLMPMQEQRPIDTFWNKPSVMYLKYRKNKKANHQQPACSIVDHPNLTLYLTGNNSSEIFTWVYQSFDDASVDVFHATSGLITQNKKSSIDKMKFNWYGDKFGALDSQKNFFLFNLDLSPACSYPYLNLQKNEIGHSISDFAFFNQSSLLACTCLKPKPYFVLYDFLMPTLEPAMKISNHGGDRIQLFPKHQKVLMLNERRGVVNVLDLRKPGTPLLIKQLHNDKITASAMYGSSFVTGGQNGVVKIWNVGQNGENFQLFQKIDAFQGKNYNYMQFDLVKPQQVSDIKVTKSGALYASSNNGLVKLLRTQI